MKPDKFFRRWKRQYLDLLDRQWRLLAHSRLEGEPDQIHNLRVTLRRLRLMVRIGRPLLDRVAVRRYRLWSRRVSDATSRLRDHDVTMEWLCTQPHSGKLIAFLKAERHQLWRICRRRLTLPSAQLRSQIARLGGGRKARQRLACRYPERFARLETRIAAEIPRFFRLNVEERHAFRRTVRLLRYLRELVLSKNRQARDELLQALLHAQAAIGEYQNLLLARHILISLKHPRPDPALLRFLAGEQSRQQSEIRSTLKALATCHAAVKPADLSPGR